MNHAKPITRRVLAARLFSGAVGLSAAAALRAEEKPTRYRGVSCQTYVFSQVLPQQGKQLADSLDLVFGDIHAAGYEGVETMAEFLGNPALAELLAKHSLKLSGIYSGGVFHEKEEGKRTVAGLAELGPRLKKHGGDVLIVNPNPIGREKTDAELETQAAMLNELGRALRDSSVRLNVHTHAPEMRRNGREFCFNLDHSDPALVWLNADINWIYRGGGDPYELLTRYVGRVGSCHLRNSVNGVWSEDFGVGDIDYRKVAKIFEALKSPIWLAVELAYEQKTPHKRSLAEDVAVSRRYVKDVFGV